MSGNSKMVLAPSGAFEPSSVDDGLKLAGILVKSGLMPSHVKTPEAAFAILAAGREMGLSPLQSMRSLYFVEGKVTLSADLIVALAKRHPECEFFRVVEATNESVTCETKRRSDPAPIKMTWTIDDAKRAGLLGKKNWACYPKAMLRARVSADLARAVYPDALMGIFDPEELGIENTAPAQVITTDGVIVETPLPPSVQTQTPAPPSSSNEDALLEVAKGFIDRVNAASDLATLKTIAQELKERSLPQHFSQPVRDAYARRRKEIGQEGSSHA